MGIKSAVQEWATGVWKEKVQTPIANKTIELENSASQQWNTYSNKAQATARKPLDYYNSIQEPFYRGLFWICILLLIVLWILSGS